MTYPNGDYLADLDASPGERAALDEVLDELDAEEAAGLPYDGDDELPPEGPWHDELSALGAIGEAIDAPYERDAQRLAENVAEAIPDKRPPSDEVKMARSLRRAASGTLVPPPQLRPARDAHGMFTSACSEVDDLGYCRARYHDPSCSAVTDAAAATGSAVEAEAWREVLGNRTPHGGLDASAIGLASPAAPQPGYGDQWSELLEPPGPAGPYGELHAAMLAELALAEAPPAPRDPRAPDVTSLREAMGI